MRRVALLFALIALVSPASWVDAATIGDSDVAALQVALRAAGTYGGPVDGTQGQRTTRAVIAFQRREGLVTDGIAGPRTRQALGKLGAPRLGARLLSVGTTGWDVSQLQYLLAWHGFPSGAFDGTFGPHLAAAILRFQRHSGLPEIGIAGPLTVEMLRLSPPSSPVRLRLPVTGSIGDPFGPRGDRFHAGVDLVAAAGTPVVAARGGSVTWAGPRGSFGNTIVVAHGQGVRTLYAHLAAVSVSVGDRVRSGQPIGLVGSSGRSTGPHLHFEVQVRGAAIDPLTAIG
jgi:murein DD-endopeptidase MepM/ murein hydrolase activator NlpD